VSEERQQYLRRCRMALYAHARAHWGSMTAAAWEDEALLSEAGLAVGSQQVEAIARLVWGIGCSRLTNR
jgi:hypothetical protein